jgi:hypothetical protein
MRQASLTAQTYPIYPHSAIIIFIIVGFHNSMPVRLWHGFKKSQRGLIYRRFERCKGRAIQPDQTRPLGYLFNTLEHMVSLYKCQGQNTEGLKSCRD